MDFVSVRVITQDVERLATFWEQLTGLPVTRPVPVFAELRTPTGTIAIGAPATVGMLGDACPVPGQNRSVFVELRVDDVDATWERIKALVPQTIPEIVLEPTDMPGQPLSNPARPRRRTSQPLYPRHAGGEGKIRPLTNPWPGPPPRSAPTDSSEEQARTGRDFP